MDVGTAEIIDDTGEPEQRPSGTLGGSSPGSGGGRDPGGGHGPNDNDRSEPAIFVPGKSRILTGFLLLVVLMTFGGLMAAYIVISTNNVAEWRPFALPVQIWISTVIILISSIAYHLGKTAVHRNDQPSAKKWFVVTTVLGAAFISSQILAWMVLVGRGLYVQGNPYAGFFYILTAVHAVHVLGGIAALGSILLRSWYPTHRQEEIVKRQTIAQVVGWYWHFMGALLAGFIYFAWILEIMELQHIFPHANAALNALSGVFLLSGFYFIMKRRIAEHRFCMLAASSVSALFLVSYLTHHAIRTYYFGLGPTKFTGEGLIRPVYFTILTSHTILAAVIGPFVIITLRRGLKGLYDKHKKLARLVFPVWLYVSVTGVIVYLLLYQIYPAR